MPQAAILNPNVVVSMASNRGLRAAASARIIDAAVGLVLAAGVDASQVLCRVADSLQRHSVTAPTENDAGWQHKMEQRRGDMQRCIAELEHVVAQRA